MRSERFDDVARALARGVTRRQVLKSLSAGAAAGLLSTLGIKPGLAAPSFAEGDSNTYLPLIRTLGDPAPSPFVGICGAASRGDAIINCSQDPNLEDCRCIETPEGNLRCGTAFGGCGGPFCTTSADCASLGAGYFCDVPGSGRCGDDKQRCLKLCEDEAPCPPDLLCGAACCEEGSVCQDGTCFDPLEGAWSGALTHEEESVGIRFVLERRGPWFSGLMYLQDPVTMEYLLTGALAAASSWKKDGSASWKISNDVEDLTDDGRMSSVLGQFVDDTFTGTYTFPPLFPESSLQVNINLKRDGQ
jgi:hypothetical protein